MLLDLSPHRAGSCAQRPEVATNSPPLVATTTPTMRQRQCLPRASLSAHRPLPTAQSLPLSSTPESLLSLPRDSLAPMATTLPCPTSLLIPHSSTPPPFHLSARSAFFSPRVPRPSSRTATCPGSCCSLFPAHPAGPSPPPTLPRSAPLAHLVPALTPHPSLVRPLHPPPPSLQLDASFLRRRPLQRRRLVDVVSGGVGGRLYLYRPARGVSRTRVGESQPRQPRAALLHHRPRNASTEWRHRVSLTAQLAKADSA